MTGAPRVSVITIFLDVEQFVEEAIRSVLAQAGPPWELILVDDGSRDASAAVARRYAAADPERIRCLAHPGGGHRGMSASRNLALAAARGDLVVFLDADDVLLPGALAEQAAILETEPRAAMVYGSSLYWWGWTGRGKDRARDFEPDLGIAADRLAEPPELALRLYPLGEAAAPCLASLMVRREAALAAGGFEEAFPGMYEDQAFLVKCYLRAPCFVSGRRWSLYRRHPDSCCEVTFRNGDYHAARLRFLRWLEGYLMCAPVGDRRVGRALDRALLPYRHPVLGRLRRPGVLRLVRRARTAAGALRRRIRFRHEPGPVARPPGSDR